MWTILNLSKFLTDRGIYIYLSKSHMNTETTEEISKTFLQKAQDIFHELINERKAIFRSEVSKEKLTEGLKKLLAIHNDQSIPYFSNPSSDFSNLDTNTKELDSLFELKKLILTLSLALDEYPEKKSETEESARDTVAENLSQGPDQDQMQDQNQEIISDAETPNSDLNQQFEIIEMSDLSSFTDNEFWDELEFIRNTLKILCNVMLNGSITKVKPGTNMIKTININRRLKLEIIQLFMIYFSITFEMPGSLFEEVIPFYSREELYTIINKIIPKVYNYNLYMQYYNNFLDCIYTSLKESNNRSTVLSIIRSIDKQFPQFPLTFEQRRANVLKILGWDTWNLEDCCDRIETRAAVLVTESPIEMCQKMSNLWMLLDGSTFLSFDDNFMAIYAFSSELSVFHEQIMRIFFIINRIDEVVRDVGYEAYATKKFVTYYKEMYTELHFLFVRLVRAINRNYEIYELECDPISGKIEKKLLPSLNMAAKLRELCIYMTCPLACLDSILRLNLDYTDLPILFDEEGERFVFTAQVQSLLVLHDFISGDREKFAEFMVELYPCLDRHFSRFHKSKKSDSQGPNTALPPSYHLFTTKPPTYENINNPSSINNNNDVNIPIDEVDENRDLCNKCCNIFPAFVFFGLFILTIFIFIWGLN